MDEDDESGMELWRQEESDWGTLDITARHSAARAGMMDMYEVEVVVEEIANETTLRKELDLGWRHTLPFWGWNPDGLCYVGRLGEMEEGKVNEWMGEVLNSEAAMEKRRRYLELLKKAVRGGVRVRDSRLELV